MIEKLNQFFSERPAISKSRFSQEADISRQLLGEILKGNMKLTDNVKEKLTPVLEKYGWKN